MAKSVSLKKRVVVFAIAALFCVFMISDVFFEKKSLFQLFCLYICFLDVFTKKRQNNVFTFEDLSAIINVWHIFHNITKNKG